MITKPKQALLKEKVSPLQKSVRKSTQLRKETGKSKQTLGEVLVPREGGGKGFPSQGRGFTSVNKKTINKTRKGD